MHSPCDHFKQIRLQHVSYIDHISHNKYSLHAPRVSFQHCTGYTNSTACVLSLSVSMSHGLGHIIYLGHLKKGENVVHSSAFYFKRCLFLTTTSLIFFALCTKQEIYSLKLSYLLTGLWSMSTLNCKVALRITERGISNLERPKQIRYTHFYPYNQVQFQNLITLFL